MSPIDIGILVGVALLSFGLAYVGASVGLVLGQLRLPILVYWIGIPAVGVGTSLAVSSLAAVVGAVRHARAGRVSSRLLLTIGLPSALAAYATSRVAASIDPMLVKGAIGVTLLITAVLMWRRKAQPVPPVSKEAPDQASSSKPAEPKDPPVNRVPLETVVGASLGAAAGMVGLLLGTLRLPLMLRLGVEPSRAIGTNMAIGCLTGLSAGIATLTTGNIDPLAFAVVTPATMLGAYLGANATGHVSKETLRNMIAWVLVVIGVWMTVESVRVLIAR